MSALSDKRLLITGPAGQIAFPLVEHLARDNEVWGIARFGDTATRERVEAVGCTTRSVDLTDPDWGDLPDHFDHVLHLAIFQSPEPDYELALRVNAEGTALLMARFANAESFLDVSSIAVYDRNADPAHLYREDDPIGETKQVYSATYSITKITQEAVVRSLARTLALPTTIARMNASYGPKGGLPAYQLDMILGDVPIPVRAGGCWFNPIHDDDIVDQLEPLLGVASVPATIVNWCGDEAVSVQQWTAWFGELLGVEPSIEIEVIPEASVGSVGDARKRISITGPCKVHWKDGLKRMAQQFYPDRVLG